MVPRAHARVACNPNIRYWQAKLAATRSRVAAIKHHTRYGGGRAGRGRRLRVDDSPSPPRPSLREGDHGKSRVGEGGVSRRVGIADGTDAEVPTCLPPIRKPKVSCTALHARAFPPTHLRAIRDACVLPVCGEQTCPVTCPIHLQVAFVTPRGANHTGVTPRGVSNEVASRRVVR